MSKITYGLLGEKLPHSFSAEIHSMIGEYDYKLHELTLSELDGFLRKKNFKAVNVTMPYKEAVIPYLDHVSDEAKTIGAVNTIVNKKGILFGYNTDYLGLRALISKEKISLHGKTVAILGTGGTSKTAKAVATALGAKSIITVSRRSAEGTVTYGELETLCDGIEIIINTTPVGMYPSADKSPVDPRNFPRLEAVIDVIYNPIRTELILQSERLGIKAVGGLYMLVAQAIYASEYFTDKKYSTRLFDDIYSRILSDKQSIVLIGMPSSGKSTVGKILEKTTNKKLKDIDSEIEITEEKTISEIFAESGESYFRDLESAEIDKYSLQNNLIIATGGGAILREENVMNLKRNGKIFFIDRPLEALMPTPDRPLAQDRAAIEKRYRERYILYRRYADHIIDANDTPESVANKIMGVFYK